LSHIERAELKIQKVYTSDSTKPETEVDADKQLKIEYIKTCKTCRKPIAESDDFVICAMCNNFVHAPPSIMPSEVARQTEEKPVCSCSYRLAPTCTQCIIRDTGVNNNHFKFLYGIYREYPKWKIQKAGRFSEYSMFLIETDLVRLKLLKEERKFLFFNTLSLTAKSGELYPILERIYLKEADVGDFMAELVLCQRPIIGRLPIIGRFFG